MATHISPDFAHKSWWQISEVVFGLPFLAAVVLHLAIPLSLPDTFLVPGIYIVGFFFILAGIVFIVLARRELRYYSQPTDPARPTTRIVTSGVFSLTRNPIYLGAVCFLTGVALLFDLLWVLIFLLPSIIACHFVLIKPEERYLAAKFGEEYRVYAAKVHRWIGHTQFPPER